MHFSHLYWRCFNLVFNGLSEIHTRCVLSRHRSHYRESKTIKTRAEQYRALKQIIDVDQQATGLKWNLLGRLPHIKRDVGKKWFSMMAWSGSHTSPEGDSAMSWMLICDRGEPRR